MKWFGRTTRNGEAYNRYLDNWEDFTIWRQLYKDPETSIDVEKLKRFDKAFSTYHELLLAIRDIIKPAKMIPASSIIKLRKLVDQMEALLKKELKQTLAGTFLSDS